MGLLSLLTLVTNERRKSVCGIVLAVTGLLFGLLANQAKANTYFDTNGATAGFGAVNGNTYDWDAVTNGGLWTSDSTGSSATTGWPQGSFPRFGPTGTPTYTITVSNDEQMAGLFLYTVQTLTINQAPSTSGDLDVTTGLQGFLGESGGTLTVNCPIVGPGGVNPSNGGTLALDGINTYSGGTSLTSSSTLIDFNNNSSFGTSTITNNEGATSFAPLLSTGGATITLPNNFVQGATSGAGINFASGANTPVVSTGTWSLGASNLNLRNNGNSTAPLTLSNTISGSAGIILSGANGGTIIFSGANNYTGTTTVGIIAGAENTIKLKLGAASTIGSTTGMTLAGATLDPDGFTQSMTSAPLSMTASSTIDYEAGASEIDFANSSASSWTGTLNLANWDAIGGTTLLRFGTDTTGLTPTQLADIEFGGNSSTLGTAGITSSGYVVETPEPASLSLLALAGTGLIARRRRRQV